MPPRKISPWTIAPEDNWPLENCPLNIKFPPKIIAPTQVNSPQRVLRVNWGKLCIVDEYYLPIILPKVKKWFTSMYFLQILTKPCRTTFIRERFSLYASWFSYARTQKQYYFFEKLIRKMQNNFIVNNNKIIRVWYLSSKWPVCRSIVN